MKMSFRFSPIFILTLMSCGQQMKANKNIEKSLFVNEGNYQARIIPLNRQLQKTSLTGEVLAKVEFTKMNVQVDVKDLSSSMIHPQYLHYGSDCPTENDDLNGDGIIDLTEAKKAMGPEIVSLGDDSKSLNNIHEFPKTNAEGELFYLKTFSDNEMKKYFLKSEFKKWSNQSLNVSKMAYLILGVSEDVEIPESAKGIAGIKTQTSIPVGCGIFEKIQIETPSTEVNGGKN